MELALPIIALGGLYMISNQNRSEQNEEGFTDYQDLPNTNIPNINYPSENSAEPPAYSQTAKLTVDNKYDGSSFTDKYFVPLSRNIDSLDNSTISLDNSRNSSVKVIEQENLQNQSLEYTSLTGDKVNNTYFSHNNMVPFYGGKNTSRASNNEQNESILDNYLGKGSQQFEKKETKPLFAPNDNYQWAYGAPNQSDFMQSRVNPSSKISNVIPFQQEKVGPGIGLGAGTEGSNGYNSGMMNRETWMPKTVDELRVKTNAKASGVGLIGHEGPAASSVKEMGSIGKLEKHGPERSFEMGHDRVLTTTGIEKGQTLRPIQEDRYTNRPETTTSYIGAAGADNEGVFVDGEYMPSKHIDLGEVPLSVANAVGKGSARNSDYGMDSTVTYNNNRTANTQSDYFGAVGGAIGAVIAPVLDILRPSRKENTIGTLRPVQNPGTKVPQSYLFNPADRPSATIRETTENAKFHLNTGNATFNKGAYSVANVQPVSNNRMNQSDYFYSGNSSATQASLKPRPYDAEYKQRNNDIKSSTIKGRMVPGGMSIMNTNTNYQTKDMTKQLSNNRTEGPLLGKQMPSTDTMGALQGNQFKPSEIVNSRNENNDHVQQLKRNPYALSITH